MAHLLTWTRIRLLARPSTIYSRYREGKHHFRWLLRWRNLPVRASPPSSPMLRLTAYLRLASCLSTPGWMCIGIEYRQAALSPSLLYRSYSSLPPLSVSLFLPYPFPISYLFPPRRRPPLPPRLRNLLPVPMKVATWSIESLLSLFRPLSLMFSHSLLLSFYNCPRFSPFLSRAFIPSMSCDAITTVSLIYPKIWVTIQLRVEANEKDGASETDRLR